MIDDNVAGEGQYYVERHPGTLHWDEWDVKCSGRFVSSHCIEHQAHKVCADLNIAYAEGRKSAKKDLHYEELSLKYLVDRHESLVDDFKELLEWANRLSEVTPYGDQTTGEFEAWKNERGIE